MKSFLLFFTVIILFLLFIFYGNARDETAHIRNSLFLEMKNYSLSFDDKRFNTDVTNKDKKQKFYILEEDESSLYILVPLPNKDKRGMISIVSPIGTIMVPYTDNSKANKIWYAKEDYNNRIAHMQYALWWKFVFFGLGALFVSLLAAWYTLKPLRSSLRLLEDFIKDIIHDLNTPLTSILLNLKMIDRKDEEIESIRTATQTIEMLHHNLDAYLREQEQTKETFTLDKVINRYVDFFTPLYDYLHWDVKLDDLILETDKQAFERVIYNLLSNACKYNMSNGKIEISLNGTILTIRNSSYGVNNPDRVFERFYKESKRGLGIGLHIVDKLCKTLEIEKRFTLDGTDVIFELNLKNITT